MKPPTGLKPAGKKFWTQIAKEFEIEDMPEVALVLEQVCRTLDMVVRLQELVDAAPSLQVPGSRGQAAALPELTELRQYRAQLAALIKQLPLEDDDDPVTGDRPMSRSESGRLAAQVRWSKRG